MTDDSIHDVREQVQEEEEDSEDDEVLLNYKYEQCVQYCIDLEKRLQNDSDTLEEIHMEAAIDAATIDICYNDDNDDDDDDDDYDRNNNTQKKKNPNSIQNCLSPYVPTNAIKIINFFEFLGFIKASSTTTTTTTTTTTSSLEIRQQQQQLQRKSTTEENQLTMSNISNTITINKNKSKNRKNVLLDIGCGDGRVCIVSLLDIFHNNISKVIGIDISPCCISNAQQIAINELGNSTTINRNNKCTFYQFDITLWLQLSFIQNCTPFDYKADIDNNINNNDKYNIQLLQNVQNNVTIIFLYTYPTLLIQLIPILSWLFHYGVLHTVVTLTYHIPDTIYNPTIYKHNTIYDMKMYTYIPPVVPVPLPVPVIMSPKS